MVFCYFECPYGFSCKNFLNDASEYERFADSLGATQLTMPPGAPPTFIPSKTGAMYFSHGCCGPATFQVGYGLIDTCINQFVYIWPKNGNGYWSWVNNVADRQYVSGLRWTDSSWVNFSESFSNIQGYYCYNPFRTSGLW